MPRSSKKQHERIKALRGALTGVDIGSSELFYKTAGSLNSALRYLSEVPKVSSVGRPVSSNQASMNIVKTFRSNGNMDIAARYDTHDSETESIRVRLVRLGVLGRYDDPDLSLDAEDGIKAVFYASEEIESRFGQYSPIDREAKLEGMLYSYVKDNPYHVLSIMSVVEDRHTADPEIIESVLGLGCNALRGGVL